MSGQHGARICLAKAKSSGTKDVLLGKFQILKFLDVMDDKTDEGKRILEMVELNELALKELVLSIDVSISKYKIAFGIVKSFKTK